MQLTSIQKTEIWQNGYTILPGAVSRMQVDAALRAINYSVGEGMAPADMTQFRAQTFCPEVASSPVVTDLFNASPLITLAESAIGPGEVIPADFGQVALRFPSLQDRPGKPGPHIDGVYTPTNGVTKGNIANFTALLAVFLSDVPRENCGNFTVWPGTHRAYEKYFREHGTDILLSRAPEVELPEPVQICARAGDAVLCHYAIGHSVAPNISPNPRYAIFFRLKHRDHDSHRFETLTDIWLDWGGMKEVVAELRNG